MAHGETFISAVSGAGVAETRPLADLLEIELESSRKTVSRTDAESLWNELTYLGSNNIAYLLRGFEGIDYPEIVRDVCRAMSVECQDGDSEVAVAANEQEVIEKLFKDAWKQMGQTERKELLREMNLDEGSASVGGAAALALILAGRAAGFAVYRLSLIVANWVARALLGRGLALGANAALVRVLGVALGPVGWVASGAWLVSDIASPAMRKTVPAVVMVAALRQQKRAGRRSAGTKDRSKAGTGREGRKRKWAAPKVKSKALPRKARKKK